ERRSGDRQRSARRLQNRNCAPPAVLASAPLAEVVADEGVPRDELLVRTVDLDRPIREEDDQAGVLDDDALAGDADPEDRSRLRHDVVLDVIRRTRQADEVRPAPVILERLPSRVPNHSVEVVVHDDVRRSAVGIEEDSEGAVLDDVLLEEERSAVDIERELLVERALQGLPGAHGPGWRGHQQASGQRCRDGETPDHPPAPPPEPPSFLPGPPTWDPPQHWSRFIVSKGLRLGNPPFPPGTQVARGAPLEIGLGYRCLGPLALPAERRATLLDGPDPFLAVQSEVAVRDHAGR